MATIVRGNVSISSNNQFAKLVPAGTTSMILFGNAFGTTLPTNGTGDYIDSINVYVTSGTTGSCSIYLADNNQGTVMVYGTIGVAGTWPIYLGLTSRFGPWRVTTQASVSAVAIGRFT